MSSVHGMPRCEGITTICSSNVNYYLPTVRVKLIADRRTYRYDKRAEPCRTSFYRLTKKIDRIPQQPVLSDYERARADKFTG